MHNILLITPPFTQLNTPYPATAYLKGFLNVKNIPSFQADLGLEVTLALFKKESLTLMFNQVQAPIDTFSENAQRIYALRNSYIERIESVINFLQGKNNTLAYALTLDDYLPRGSRFTSLVDVQDAFGNMGIQDKAKYYATLFLEDIADFIKECIDPHFGFSRYAEKLGRSAYSFNEMYDALQQPFSLVDEWTITQLNKLIEKNNPKVVALTAPFPGNVYAAFRCGRYIKKNHPHIKIIFGGGFPNTELRSLSEVRVFEFVDFITLDDGEAPIECILQYLEDKIDISMLKRTFVLLDNKVQYINNSLLRDYKQHEVGTPDYTDLWLNEYVSVVEILNPMNRLWSDGRWNKLTMAHGCYWGKCTFCDVSLDYIKNYEPIQAKLLVDRMEQLMEQTGNTGFHFVDEAAPPALMRDLSIEIIKRNLSVSWWTNIRFEKSFNNDLCSLLKTAGCIGVSGGLEVASDRLLHLIEKGIDIAQVCHVLKNFHSNGIMVHAYLMYGYPTQTVQETIDSLEVVRQLFLSGILKSAFWHQFALTVHSPIGMNPEKYGIIIDPQSKGSFANNDLIYNEKSKVVHDHFSFGLKKSLFNYMHHTCLEDPLQKWFDFKTPITSHDKDYIETILLNTEIEHLKPNAKVYWVGSEPNISFFTKNKKGNQWQMAEVSLHSNKEHITLSVTEDQGKWLQNILKNSSIHLNQYYMLSEVQASFEKALPDEDFELFWFNKVRKTLRNKGLIIC